MGFQEQNPYLVVEPLYEAWRQGWFAGIDTHKESDFCRNRDATPSVLNQLYRRSAGIT